jgi:hypothetical protein
MRCLKTLNTNFLILFISCGEDDETAIPVTGISMDATSLSVALESTGVLTATLAPTDATGDITWSSSDPSIAAVNNGIITAIKIGTATVVASHSAFTASCTVTVTPKAVDPGDVSASLKGSDYYIIQIDEISYNSISDKVLEDMRPDDIEASKNLFIWDDTFIAGASTGLNSYGQAEGWISLVVGSAGWSGAGYNVGASYEGELDLTNMYDAPEDYVLHIALKGDQAASSFLFILADGSAEAKICIGSSAYNDAGVNFEPYADFARDNEWHEIEIPLTVINDLGVYYNAPFKDKNVFAFLAGGTAGVKLDMDAMFFYKKAK